MSMALITFLIFAVSVVSLVVALLIVLDKNEKLKEDCKFFKDMREEDYSKLIEDEKILKQIKDHIPF